MTELELVRNGIDANLGYLHTQRWALQAAQLRQTLTKAPEKEKAAATRALIITTREINQRPAVLPDAGRDCDYRGTQGCVMAARCRPSTKPKHFALSKRLVRGCWKTYALMTPSLAKRPAVASTLAGMPRVPDRRR